MLGVQQTCDQLLSLHGVPASCCKADVSSAFVRRCVTVRVFPLCCRHYAHFSSLLSSLFLLHYSASTSSSIHPSIHLSRRQPVWTRHLLLFLLLLSLQQNSRGEETNILAVITTRAASVHTLRERRIISAAAADRSAVRRRGMIIRKRLTRQQEEKEEGEEEGGRGEELGLQQ